MLHQVQGAPFDVILAGIDIGTNAVRLLVTDINGVYHRELFSRRISTRLGQDIDRTGCLSPDAQERTLSALEHFMESIRRFDAVQTVAVGTSALRNAVNAAEFISAARIRTGLDIRIIDGESEARLTLIGVQKALSGNSSNGTGADYLKRAIVLDVGGGSTELIVTRDSAAQIIVSLPLGAVYLTERFLKNDPPSDGEIRGLRHVVAEELETWERSLQGQSLDHIAACAGTAGTVTTLAAMDLELPEYTSEKINGYILTAVAVDSMINTLSACTLLERAKLPGLEQGRADIVLAGAIIVQEILQRYGFFRMLVSDWGLREGIVFDLHDRIDGARISGRDAEGLPDT